MARPANGRSWAPFSGSRAAFGPNEDVHTHTHQEVEHSTRRETLSQRRGRDVDGSTTAVAAPATVRYEGRSSLDGRRRCGRKKRNAKKRPAQRTSRARDPSALLPLIPTPVKKEKESMAAEPPSVIGRGWPTPPRSFTSSRARKWTERLVPVRGRPYFVFLFRRGRYPSLPNDATATSGSRGGPRSHAMWFSESDKMERCSRER